MPSESEMVAEFHDAFGLGATHTPALWVKLINEERDELIEALINQDFVEILDAICDLKYVVNGLGICLGFDPEILDLAAAEVHRSNMTKLDDEGKPIRREDGKIMKGPRFEAPRLQEILDGRY